MIFLKTDDLEKAVANEVFIIPFVYLDDTTKTAVIMQYCFLCDKNKFYISFSSPYV